MAFVISNIVPREDNLPPLRRVEVMMLSASDIPQDNDETAPGSIAHTADMKTIYMYDGTTWVQVKGGGGN